MVHLPMALRIKSKLLNMADRKWTWQTYAFTLQLPLSSHYPPPLATEPQCRTLFLPGHSLPIIPLIYFSSLAHSLQFFQFRLYFLRRAFFYCDSVGLYQILLSIVLAPCPFPSQSSPPVLMKWVWDNWVKVESSDYLINSTRPGTMTVLFIFVPPALRRTS